MSLHCRWPGKESVVQGGQVHCTRSHGTGSRGLWSFPSALCSEVTVSSEASHLPRDFSILYRLPSACVFISLRASSVFLLCILWAVFPLPPSAFRSGECAPVEAPESLPGVRRWSVHVANSSSLLFPKQPDEAGTMIVPHFTGEEKKAPYLAKVTQLLKERAGWRDEQPGFSVPFQIIFLQLPPTWAFNATLPVLGI